ncbi:hypothetical protein D1871_15130 [Nakamurella silvestris]|nr:hypothetical protein D1871_15130 [Nakamurella silvestris]
MVPTPSGSASPGWMQLCAGATGRGQPGPEDVLPIRLTSTEDLQSPMIALCLTVTNAVVPIGIGLFGFAIVRVIDLG